MQMPLLTGVDDMNPAAPNVYVVPTIPKVLVYKSMQDLHHQQWHYYYYYF